MHPDSSISGLSTNPRLPLDVLLHIIEFVDHPKDLLAFALTTRALHASIIPRHIDYRHISCQLCSATEKLWQHLLDTPVTCSRIRSISTLSSDHSRLPRMCKMDPGSGAWWYLVKTESTLCRAQDYTSDTFIAALSRMNNLKVFRLYTWDLTAKNICAISDAIGRAGCQLEELELHFRVNEAFEQHFEETEGKVPLFLDRLPQLRRYVIYGCSSIANSNVFLHMLSSAPNLTHIDVSFVSSPSLFRGNWPNLQHFVVLFRSKCYQETLPENQHKSDLQSFFYRHSKLTTLSSNNILIPGWATESGDFLPNLKSLRITIEPPQVPTIPSNIAARLTHLDMDIALHSHLQEHKIVLSNLETCRYQKADSRASIQGLVDIIPNIQKLFMDFGNVQVLPNTTNGFQSFASRGMTACEFQDQISFFACLKRLRILVGPFDQVNVSVDDHPLLGLLYNLPSLSYIRTKVKHGCSFEFICLKRDEVAEVMRYEQVDSEVCSNVCNVNAWGGFSLRRYLY